MSSSVSPPFEATAVVVDMRDFTRELNATSDLDGSREAFCGLLAQMNLAVVDASRLALRPHQQTEHPLWVHIGSTGDGALLVFRHPEDHIRHAALAVLLLRAKLDRACRAYQARTTDRLDFGIGVETGQVRRVGSIELSTYIGGCINLASRIQEQTRTIARTRVVYGALFIETLLEELFQEDWRAVFFELPAGLQSDEEYLANERRRNALNRRLCVSFLHQHLCRGFSEPRSLFRLSRSSAVLGNPRFDEVLNELASGDEQWLAAIRSVLA